MHDTVIIRPAVSSDAQAIIALARQLTAHEISISDDDEPRSCDLTVDQLDQYCFSDRPFAFILVVEQSGSLVGYAQYGRILDLENGPGVWLGDLFIVEEVRGNGLGRRLFAALIEAGIAFNATWMSWQVIPSNTNAMRLYDGIADQDPDLNYWTTMDDLRSRLGT